MVKESEIDFIPDRLNNEPVIYMGMSNSELKMLALVAIGFWVPLCLLISILLGFGVLGLGAGMVLALATLWFAGKKLRVFKRGKPSHYHSLLIRSWFEDKKLLKPTMIRTSQIWGIARTHLNKPYISKSGKKQLPDRIRNGS